MYTIFQESVAGGETIHSAQALLRLHQIAVQGYPFVLRVSHLQRLIRIQQCHCIIVALFV